MSNEQSDSQPAQYHVGVKILPNGSKDYSHAASWRGPQLGKKAKELQASKSKDQLTEIPIPANWTYLIHGTNLAKPEWTEERKAMLDQDTFTISLGLGLSTVEKSVSDYRQKEELEALQRQGIASQGFNTARDYAQGSGQVVEMRVIFPKFDSQMRLDPDAERKLVEKYGEARIRALMELADLVYFQNIKGRSHPLLPRHLVLVKRMDQTIGGKRIIQYVPQPLLDIYDNEIGQKS